FERYLVDDGILLIKFWMEVSDAEQKRRFEAHIHDPLRQWKLSPTDLCSRSKWFEYSRARDAMLDATDTKFAPWCIEPDHGEDRGGRGLDHRGEEGTGGDRAEATGDELLERAAQRVAGEALHAFGEVVDAEQEEAESTQKRDHDGVGHRFPA